MSRGWSLLHLTDLHLDAESNYIDTDKEHTSEQVRSNVVARFERLIRNEAFGDLNAIAVTGDITNRGEPKGFDHFARLAPSLLERVATPRALCVVPGNHDVKWNLELEAENYYDEKFAGFAALIEKLGATTSLLPTGSGVAAELRFQTQTDPLFIDPKRKLLVACINSAIRCGEVARHRRRDVVDPITNLAGWIGELRSKHSTRVPADVEQWLRVIREKAEAHSLFDVAHATEAQRSSLVSALDRARDRLAGDWSSFLRVGILHHHVVPFRNKVVEHKPFDLMLDCTALLELFDEYHFDLVLTGHQHQPYVEEHRGRLSRIVLIGGPTVGGFPVTGEAPGFRHITVSRPSDRKLGIRLSSLPLHHDVADAGSFVRRCFEDAKEIQVETPRRHGLTGKPPPVMPTMKDVRRSPLVPIHRAIDEELDWFNEFEQRLDQFRPQLDSSMLYYGPGLAKRWLKVAGRGMAFQLMNAEFGERVRSLAERFVRDGEERRLSVIDLGVGDAQRGALMTRALTENSRQRVDLVWVDVSWEMLEACLNHPASIGLLQELSERGGRLSAVNTTFMKLPSYREVFPGDRRSLFLLLGNTLGNEANETSTLATIASLMQSDDRLLVEVQLIEPTPRTAEQVLETGKLSADFYFGPFGALGCRTDKMELKVQSEELPHCVAWQYSVAFKERLFVAHPGFKRPKPLGQDVGVYLIRKYFDSRDAFETLFGGAGLIVEDYDVSPGKDRRFGYVYARRAE